MPNRKKPKPEKHPPSPLEGMPTRDLLKSIRDDLAEKARQVRESGLVHPEKPAKPKKS